MVCWKLEYSERTETLCSMFHLIRKDCLPLVRQRMGKCHQGTTSVSCLPFGFSLQFWDRVGLTTGFCFYADYQFVWLLDSWRIWKGLSYSDDLIIVIPWFLQNCLSLAFWLHTFRPAVGCVYVCVCVCVCIKCETRIFFPR